MIIQGARSAKYILQEFQYGSCRLRVAQEALPLKPSGQPPTEKVSSTQESLSRHSQSKAKRKR